MGRWIRLLSVILLVMGLPRVTTVASQPASQQTSGDHRAATPGQPTPPYHKSAKDAKPFPPLMPATRFADRPVIAWAYQLSKQGKTPSEIREGIIHGDWQKIDVNRPPR